MLNSISHQKRKTLANSWNGSPAAALFPRTPLSKIVSPPAPDAKKSSGTNLTMEREAQRLRDSDNHWVYDISLMLTQYSKARGCLDAKP